MNRKKEIKRLLNDTIKNIEKYDDVNSEVAEKTMNDLIERIGKIQPEDNNIIKFLFRQPIDCIKNFFTALFKDLLDGLNKFKKHKISRKKFRGICLKTLFKVLLSGIIIFLLFTFSFGSSAPFFSVILTILIIGFAAQNYVKK